VASSVCHTPFRLVSTIVVKTGSVWCPGRRSPPPGVCNDDVDVAEFVDPGLHCGFQLRQVTNVGDDGHYPAAGGFDQPCGLVEIGFGAQRVGNCLDVGADINGDDVCALFGERDGVAAALARAAPVMTATVLSSSPMGHRQGRAGLLFGEATDVRRRRSRKQAPYDR